MDIGLVEPVIWILKSCQNSFVLLLCVLHVRLSGELVPIRIRNHLMDVRFWMCVILCATKMPAIAEKAVH
jgi:hypothetical protein